MYDVIVIGAGQAGLAIGYYLQKKGLSFLILDQAKEVGESWKKRYDSLTLFTPRIYSSLPGMTIEGEPSGYPTKDEISDYLAQYAKTFSLPIELDTYIIKLKEFGDQFLFFTNKGQLTAKNVVVATGPFQLPYTPYLSKDLASNILQWHSSEYKNSSQLTTGETLVVGGGNSGAQIASEISQDRTVYISVGHPLKFIPQDIRNKSIFWWFDKLGILRVNVNSKMGSFLKSIPDPIFGFELKEKIKQKKVIVKPKVTSAKGDSVFFQDGSSLKVNNVIWSTGYHTDYSWIQIPWIFDHQGLPLHERGKTKKKGLYFIGMPWQYRKGSAILQGVGLDARYIVSNLENDKG